jgi:5-formyltetrahydrofolate cyclo-ligase
VPGLAFSLDGKRLGRGKGYYDRFLNENNVKAIALCYNEQIKDTIPTEEYDARVSLVITDNRGGPDAA